MDNTSETTPGRVCQDGKDTTTASTTTKLYEILLEHTAGEGDWDGWWRYNESTERWEKCTTSPFDSPSSSQHAGSEVADEERNTCKAGDDKTPVILITTTITSDDDDRNQEEEFAANTRRREVFDFSRCGLPRFSTSSAPQEEAKIRETSSSSYLHGYLHGEESAWCTFEPLLAKARKATIKAIFTTFACLSGVYIPLIYHLLKNSPSTTCTNE